MFVAEFRQREGFVARVGDEHLVVHGLSDRSGQRGSGEAPPAARDFLQLFDREFRFRRRRSGHFDHDLIGDVGERFAAARARGRGRHRGFIGVCAGRIEHVTARVRHGPFVRQLAFSRAACDRACVALRVGEFEPLREYARVGDDDLVIDRLPDRPDQWRLRKAAPAAGDFLELFDREFEWFGRGYFGRFRDFGDRRWFEAFDVHVCRRRRGPECRSDCGQGKRAADHDGEAHGKVAAFHELPPRRLDLRSPSACGHPQAASHPSLDGSKRIPPGGRNPPRVYVSKGE